MEYDSASDFTESNNATKTLLKSSSLGDILHSSQERSFLRQFGSKENMHDIKSKQVASRLLSRIARNSTIKQK